MKLLALANFRNSTRTAGGGVRGFSSEKTRAKISSGVSKKIALWSPTSSLSNNKQVSVVLGIDFSVPAKRSRSVGCADGELLEDFLLQDSALTDCVQVAVFAVGVHRSVPIHYWSVDAPLEAMGMIGDAGQRTIRVSCTALGIRVLKAPLAGEVGTDLAYEILFR